MARTHEVKIRVTEEIYNEFKKLAESYGMSMSALGSYVVGNHVKQHTKVIDPIMDKLGGEIFKIMADQINKNEK